MTESIDQFAKTYSLPPLKERPASRGLIVENGKILLSYESNTNVYMTPGGGLEENETLEECCVRELREETGYDVIPVERFVVINEYCFNTLYISNYFVCKIIDKSEQSLTGIEIEHGMKPVWLDIDIAMEIFSDYPNRREDISSLYLREFTVLNKYLSSVK